MLQAWMDGMFFDSGRGVFLAWSVPHSKFQFRESIFLSVIFSVPLTPRGKSACTRTRFSSVPLGR